MDSTVTPDQEGSANVLIESIVTFYEMDVFRHAGLRMGDRVELAPPSHNRNLTGVVEVTGMDSNGLISWSFDIGQSEGSLPASSLMSVPFELKYKERHEFVSKGLGLGVTDRRFKDVFDPEDDEDDNRTPDFIVKENGLYHVIEIATTKGGPQSLVTAFDTKIFSYENAVRMRSLKVPVSYTVIVVGPAGVLSNVWLPEALVNELHVRLLIAFELEDKAASLGFKMSVSDTFSMKEDISEWIYGEVERLNFKRETEDFLMDEDYIQSLKVEPDQNEVVRTFVSELLSHSSELVPTLSQQSDKVRKYENDFLEGTRRYDRKPVCNLPFLNLKRGPGTAEMDFQCILEGGENPTLTKLWGEALGLFQLDPDYRDESPQDLLCEALEEDPTALEELEEKRKEGRNKYHRVDLSKVLDPHDMEVLADQGLWAKRFKDLPNIRERRAMQKSPFGLETDLGDIDDVLSRTDFLDESGNDEVESADLLRRANEISGNSNECLNQVLMWSKTKLFTALDIVSDIAYEVAISNKQNCSGRTMILKKTRKYPVHLLISPTKSTEHTFISVMVPKDPTSEILCELPFRKSIDTDRCKLYDFVSFKQGKLENLCSMPHSLISLASFWSNFYGIDCTPDSFRKCPEAFKMLMLTILIRMEDKAQTEETITQTRYMYMEMFKYLCAHRPPDPMKVLSKLTTSPRSRLNLWCIRSIVKVFSSMVSDVGSLPQRHIKKFQGELIDGEDQLPQDSWKGLLNWATGTSVPTATKVVDLMYLGYLKNKDETPEGNTDFAIVEKTLEEEFDLDRKDVKASMGEPTSKPRAKQFSKKHVIHGCSILEKRLASLYGADWKIVVGREILDKMSEKTTDEIASLKASANVSHMDCTKKASLTDPIFDNRIKVVEAVAKRLEEFQLNPLANIGHFIEYIENTSKGVIADLFKKNQHGGTREIYVLTIQSRVVQLFVETIARVLCSYFEEETLTHPSNKLRKLDEHRVASARFAHKERCLYTDFCSSTDKTRWNQNLVMGSLAVPLIRLTPEVFHPAIQRILNLWSKKLIKLPQRVCQLLLNDTPLSSGTFKKLHDYFWNPNESEGMFSTRCGKFVRLTSGMMQGILHYSSSLLHLCFLNSMNVACLSYLRVQFPRFRFRMSQVCSSDDSATILSVFSPPMDTILTESSLRVYYHASFALDVLNYMAPYYCMKDSVKSTNGVVDYVEFNSEFLFRNTIAMPSIKLVAASLSITESESFLERFHTQYNLISDLFSSGFPAQNTHICQIAQAMCHYKTMGQSTNPLFGEWEKRIIDHPDPIYGFFLLDVSLMPGVAGYSLSHWLASKNTPIFRWKPGHAVAEPVVVSPEGGILNTLTIKHGDVKRWKTLVATVGGDIDLNGEVEKNPEILFRKPKTVKEMGLRLVLLTTMPGVASSMRKGNAFMQALAMSVYAINTHCFTKTTVTTDFMGQREKVTEKTSLLLEVHKRVRGERSIPSKEELQIAFPSQDRYEEIMSVVTRLRSAELVRCHFFRRKRGLIFVQPRVHEVPLSLMKVVTKLWFGHSASVSESIYRKCLSTYQNRLPWIMETFEETLKASPFTTPQELYSFLSTQTSRSRVFARTGPGLNTNRLRGQVYQLIRKSQRDGFVLREDEKEKIPRQNVDLVSGVSLALCLPGVMARRKAVYGLLESEKMYESPSDMASMSKREANLGFIQAFHNKDVTPLELTTLLTSCGRGLLINYIREQRREGDSWMGRGTCVVISEGVRLVAHLNDKEVELLETPDLASLRRNPSAIAAFYKELKVRPARSSGRLLSHGGQPHCRFDGRTFVHVGQSGTLVRQTPNMELTLFELKHPQCVLSRNKIEIVYKSGGREINLISFKHRPGDVILKPPGPESADLSTAWRDQCPIAPMTGIKWIEESIKLPIRDERRVWIADTLLARLKQEGESPDHMEGSRFTEVVSDTMLGEEITDEFIDDMLMSFMEMEATPVIAQNLMRCLDHEEEDPVLHYMMMDPDDEVWDPVIHNLLGAEVPENIEVTKKDEKAFKCLHPLWSLVIKELRKDNPRFWQRVLGGHPAGGFDDYKLVESIQKLLSITMRPRAQSLRERLSTVEIDLWEEDENDQEASRETSSEETEPSSSD